jgi:GMP synthase-like glutamine amidotransferase
VAVAEPLRSERRGLILSHGDDSPVGLLGEWLTEHGCGYEVHDVTEVPLPRLDDFSFIASLGSVHSATDTDPPWVAAEIELLREAIAAELPVLGLCFGGQALSIALGGSVAPAAKPQVGWFELSERVEEIPPGPWFHWHYEQLSVPPGGEPLAHSEAGPAAFRHGRHIGLQFHPEVTLEVIASWARSETELAKLGVSPDALRAQSAVLAPLARHHAWELFGLWWEGLAGEPPPAVGTV